MRRTDARSQPWHGRCPYFLRDARLASPDGGLGSGKPLPGRVRGGKRRPAPSHRDGTGRATAAPRAARFGGRRVGRRAKATWPELSSWIPVLEIHSLGAGSRPRVTPQARGSSLGSRSFLAHKHSPLNLEAKKFEGGFIGFFCKMKRQDVNSNHS